MTNTKNIFSLFLFAFAVSLSFISYACPTCPSHIKTKSCELDEPKNVDEAKSVRVQKEKDVEVKVEAKAKADASGVALAKTDVMETVIPVKKESTVLAKNEFTAPETEKVDESEDVSDDSCDDDDDDFEFDEKEFKKSLEAFAEMFKDGEEPGNSTKPLTA